jgi:RNAse (barnase) inhibitor barstar
MRELILNGAEWKTRDDVYDSFFRLVGAPEWHGRNFDALRDSIATGSINAVEVPYRLVIYELRQDRCVSEADGR